MSLIDLDNYESRKASFEEFKDTLPKESSDDVKKEYNVGCFQKSDWEFIHAELMKDGSLEDNIPTDKCDCINDCLQSDLRGTYLLTDAEATELRANPRVEYVNIKANSYPGTYLNNPDDFSQNPIYRYASTAKHQQQILRYNNTSFSNSGSLIENPAPSSLLNRCSSQLYRHTVKKNPWVTNGNPQTIFDDRIYQYGTGTDVDIIVCDTNAWFGHMEFMNPNRITNIKASTNVGGEGGNSSTTAPSNYVGGNVLKSGFAASATNGACDVLDLVLDAPYYIDSAWFEADAGNRLMTRWDGTKVPVESVAREWWSDSSKRSASYSSVGTVTIPSGYTRDNCNGSHTALPTLSEQHGTACASQAYGRSHGWAYNANKWYLNLYGGHGIGLNDADGFDIQKIFHQNKPNRASDNTKNPTVSSNSWGRRFSTGTLGTSGYYYHRPATVDGTTSGVQYTSWDMDGNTDGTGGTAPRFMTNRAGAGAQVQCEPVSGSSKTGLDELAASGVIGVYASGNHNQKQVKSDHPDYNNYFSPSDNTALSASTFYFNYDAITYRRTLNRGGFPNATSGIINVGALDNEFTSGKERKVFYSSSGNYVDCYAVAGGSPSNANAGTPETRSLAASAYPNITGNTTYGLVPFTRYDSFYTYDSSQSIRSGEFYFNGTSAACPIAAGLIATKLQYNRTWTTTNIKSWLTSTVGQQDTNDFYYGSEGTTPNDSSWTDKNSLQGGPAIVAFDTAIDTTNPTLISSIPSNNATGVAINTNIVLNFSEAVDAESGNIVIYKASDDSVIETIDVTSGQVTGSGTSQITVNPSSDLAINTTFYIQIAATAFDDAAGNSYAGISDTTSLRFTTVVGDITNPTLISSVPSNGAIGVAINTNIVLNFSEAVIAQSGGNIVIYRTSDDSVIETISVTSGQVTGSGTSQITINPSSDLADDTVFYVQISATAFDDSAGNSYAGISDKTSLTFSTADPPPTVDGEFSIRFTGGALLLIGGLDIS